MAVESMSLPRRQCNTPLESSVSRKVLAHKDLRESLWCANNLGSGAHEQGSYCVPKK